MPDNTATGIALAEHNYRQQLAPVRARLEDGTATEEDINTIRFIAETDNGRFFHLVSDIPQNSQFIQNNPLLNDYANQLIASGAIPPTAQSQIQNTVGALTNSLPDIENLFNSLLENELNTQLEFDPQFAQQEFDLASEFEPQFAELFNQIGVDSVEQFGPLLRELEGILNPETEALREELNRQVLEELNLGGQLSPDQTREIEQSIRGAQTSRGTTFGNSSVSAEALAKGSFAEQLRQSRKRAAADVIALNASTQVDPISTLLGRQVTRTTGAPSSTAIGNSFLPFAQQQQNSLGVVPFNQRQAEIQSFQNQLASREANRRARSGTGSALGSIAGTALGTIFPVLGGPAGGAALGSSLGTLFGG